MFVDEFDDNNGRREMTYFENVNISLRNMKILKISRSKQKRHSPRMLIITDVFEENAMLELQDKNCTVQECL